jgi:hypothetical protein
MVTTGRGGTVLASFRCNFTLKASGTGFESSCDIDTPGSNATSSSHASLESVMSLWSAKETAVRKAILNFNLIHRAFMSSEEAVFDIEIACWVSLRQEMTAES